METRDYKSTVEVREGPNGTATITGYGIVFNSDSENLGGFIEQVDPGSVTKTLAEADIRGIANHDSNWLLGRRKSGTARFTADTIGVRYEIDVNLRDPDGVRAVEKVRRGDWDGSSFCFETLQESWDWDATPARRRLLEIKIVEMGPVTFPAYPDSTATARGALSRIAKKLGQPVERMVEALKNGEIRSLIDIPEEESILEVFPEVAEDVAAVEERVGKKLSAKSLAAIQRAIAELQDLMEGPEEPEPDMDVDDPARGIVEKALGELRVLTTDDFKPDPEPEPEPVSVMQRATALARLRQRELELLELRYLAA